MRGKCDKHNGLIYFCTCTSSTEVFTNKTGELAIGHTVVKEGTRVWWLKTNLAVYVTAANPESWGWESLGYL
jgi:hypothetical protein